MRPLRVCIGSACHLKGSYEIIETFKQMIQEKNLEDQIELKAAFCLGRCTEAVSVERWDGEIMSVSKDTAQEIFEEKIVSVL